MCFINILIAGLQHNLKLKASIGLVFLGQIIMLGFDIETKFCFCQ